MSTLWLHLRLPQLVSDFEVNTVWGSGVVRQVFGPKFREETLSCRFQPVRELHAPSSSLGNYSISIGRAENYTVLDCVVLRYTVCKYVHWAFANLREGLVG